MLLTVDVGNTNITLGVFDKERLLFESRMATDHAKTADQYAIELQQILRLNGVDPATVAPRFCGEFRYESTFECSNGNATTLMIPQAGDAAELILNGVNCGVAFGPCCIFNVAGIIKSGTNTLEIKTFDSPAYADRTGDKNIGWGSGFPLRAHGFVGKIMLG